MGTIVCFVLLQLPGVSEEVANCFSDQERAILFDALQTTSQHHSSNVVTRSKVKGLIEGADVILKAVLRGSLTNINASQVIAKIVEVSKFLKRIDLKKLIKSFLDASLISNHKPFMIDYELSHDIHFLI